MPNKVRHLAKQRSRLATNPALEKTVLFVAIVEPLMTTPQIWQIYRSPSAGVSTLTWALYMGASVVWVAYGLKIRSIPIILTSVLWIIVEAAVIIGVLTR